MNGLRSGMIERFRAALPVLQELQKDLEWIENEFSLSSATEEERSQVKRIRELAYNNFSEVSWRLEQMFMPIKSKGVLFQNSAGRYQIENTDRYFTSGDTCEVFLPYYSGDDEHYTWIPTSVEYRAGYHFTARPNVPMKGALVRTRGY